MAKRTKTPEDPPCVLVPRPKPNKAAVARAEHDSLVGIKNEVFGDAMLVLKDHMRFRDVDADKDKGLDPGYHAMVAEMGREEADKAYKLAIAGWMGQADAPVGIKNAMNIAIGVMKANAAEKGGSKVLNIQKVEINANSVPQFEEIEVE